eukprot:365978-Chlamydomonas_euryale.AAC.4
MRQRHPGAAHVSPRWDMGPIPVARLSAHFPPQPPRAPSRCNGAVSMHACTRTSTCAGLLLPSLARLPPYVGPGGGGGHSDADTATAAPRRQSRAVRWTPRRSASTRSAAGVVNDGLHRALASEGRNTGGGGAIARR